MDCQETLFFTIESDLWVKFMGKVEDMKRYTEMEWNGIQLI